MGQGFIDYSPSKVKKKLEQYMAKNELKAVLIQTDSVISLKIDDPRGKPATFQFHFLEQKCVEEIKIACDTCVINYLNGILQDKSMGWKNMNQNTWVSKFSKHRMMFVESNGTTYSLRIRKTNWDKKTYNGVIASLD